MMIGSMLEFWAVCRTKYDDVSWYFIEAYDVRDGYETYQQVLADMETCGFQTIENYKDTFVQFLWSQKEQIVTKLGKMNVQVWTQNPTQQPRIKAVEAINKILKSIDQDTTNHEKIKVE
jgi:hypothetical protein